MILKYRRPAILDWLTQPNVLEILCRKRIPQSGLFIPLGNFALKAVYFCLSILSQIIIVITIAVAFQQLQHRITFPDNSLMSDVKNCNRLILSFEETKTEKNQILQNFSSLSF